MAFTPEAVRHSKWGPPGRVLGPVGVAPMVDVEDDHGAALLVDAVTDAVLAPPCPPQAFERCSERSTYRARSLTKRSDDELPRCKGGSGRERLRERAAGTGRESDAVGRLVSRFSRHGARAAGASP